MSAKHKPVMLEEAVVGLQVQPARWYIDATFGRGGHTAAILDAGGRVLALDFDQDAIAYGQEAFKAALDSDQLILERANFSQLADAAKKHNCKQIAGILFDFGTSVDQLTDQDRGFSFEGDGPLDMRMDDNLGVTAADLLAALSEKQLSQLFKEFGGEQNHRKIAQVIVSQRQSKPITTTSQLVSLIESVNRRQGKLHPATKVFQALRIAVNTELDNIAAALPQALEVLAPSGRVVTISFHEGEDRLAKQSFRQWQQDGLGTVLTTKPMTASEEEITQNPPSRSAKVRIFEKGT